MIAEDVLERISKKTHQGEEFIRADKPRRFYGFNGIELMNIKKPAVFESEFIRLLNASKESLKR